MEFVANTVAVYFVLQFLWSYYRTAYSRGYKLDFWHFYIAQTLFVLHVQLPFARSPLNAISIGPILTRRMIPFVDEAYLISALGYACILIGGQLWRVRLGTGTRRLTAQALSLPARWWMLLLESPGPLMAMGVVSISISVVLIAIYFRAMGIGTNLGGYTLVHTSLRPVANLALFLGLQVGSVALIRAIVYKERRMWGLFTAICVSLFFHGSRSTIVFIWFNAVIVWMIALRHRLKFWIAAVGVYALLLVSMGLDALRHGSFSFTKVLATLGISVFYGNSFSDLRDFAITMSFWNGQFFHGLTYLAGMFAFVPRSLSTFRDHWSIGVVTATMAGFRPTEHPGLRVGLFGEAYLNFSFLGVILLGLLIGCVIRFMDLRIKEAIANPGRRQEAYAYFALGAFMTPLINSSAASTLYTTILLYVAVYAAVRISRGIKRRASAIEAT